MDNQPDETPIEQKLITYSDGTQIITQTTPSARVQMIMPDAEITQEDIIQLNDKELNDLMPKLVTHRVEVDTMGENISIIAKETAPDTPSMQTQTTDTPGVNQV